MSTKAKALSFKQIANEAVFQLACSEEFTRWMVSLMKAIKSDHDHDGGRNAKGLSDLGVYLAEAHLADVELASEELNANAEAVEQGGAQ